MPSSPFPTASGFTSAPLWRSAFRPFYLLGATYGLLLMLAWLGAGFGLPLPLPPGMALKFWHGHEIVFGFAGAIIIGIVLTALPSWAGIEEIEGGRLALLVALWLAGRCAFLLAAFLPAALVTVIDCAFFPLVAAQVTPRLLRARNPLYLLLLPVLAGLCAANVAFHLGSFGFGLRLALYSIMLLFALKAGVLAPVFTSNALREKNRAPAIAPCVALDLLAAGTITLLAGADLAALPAPWSGSLAGLAAIVHALRLARWRSWLVTDVALVFSMHIAYAWLVLALALKSAAQFTAAVPPTAWLHAFTVGALGMMMMGLMTRVVLRHTGRPLTLPPALRNAFWLMFSAAVLRTAAALGDFGPRLVTLSAMLWMAAFVIFLACCAAMLVLPSMPPQRHG